MSVTQLKSDPHFQSVGQAAASVVAAADPYGFWRRALEMGGGRQLTREQCRTLQITTEPKCGFYRKRNKDGEDHAVAIWRFDGDVTAGFDQSPDGPKRVVEIKRGQMIASIGRSEDVWLADVAWTWCCSWPISYETYQAVTDGGAWPDDAPTPAAVIGHNMPDDPHEAAKFEFEGDRELAEEFLKTPITTQDQADRAAVWAKKLSDLHGRVDKMFRAEKDPIVQAGRDVDEKFRWREDAKALSTKLKRAQDAFLNEQDRLEKERQRKAREEAEKLQREAEAKARAAEQAAKKASDEERAKLQREADEAAAAAAAKSRETQEQKVSAGRTGARTSLRTFVDAEITDYPKLVEALRDRQEMKELVQSLANRAAKAGVELAGMKIRTERRAA